MRVRPGLRVITWAEIQRAHEEREQRKRLWRGIRSVLVIYAVAGAAVAGHWLGSRYASLWLR